MTVKEVIIIASTLMDREDIVKYLNGEENNPSEEVVACVDLMVRLLNLVVSELACSFIPMIRQETLTPVDGKIYYTALKRNPLEILSVLDDYGYDRKGAVTSQYVFASGDRVNVEYSFFPKPFSITDELEYAERDVSPRVLAYGLVAEYALSKGYYKDAVTWHKRYEDGVAQICTPKNSKIKCRRWL